MGYMNFLSQFSGKILQNSIKKISWCKMQCLRKKDITINYLYQQQFQCVQYFQKIK